MLSASESATAVTQPCYIDMHDRLQEYILAPRSCVQDDRRWLIVKLQ